MTSHIFPEKLQRKNNVSFTLGTGEQVTLASDRTQASPQRSKYDDEISKVHIINIYAGECI